MARAKRMFVGRWHLVLHLHLTKSSVLLDEVRCGYRRGFHGGRACKIEGASRRQSANTFRAGRAESFLPEKTERTFGSLIRHSQVLDVRTAALVRAPLESHVCAYRAPIRAPAKQRLALESAQALARFQIECHCVADVERIRGDQNFAPEARKESASTLLVG